MQEIQEKLRQKANASGMSGYELSKKTSIHTSAMYRFLEGRDMLPESLEKLIPVVMPGFKIALIEA